MAFDKPLWQKTIGLFEREKEQGDACKTSLSFEVEKKVGGLSPISTRYFRYLNKWNLK